MLLMNLRLEPLVLNGRKLFAGTAAAQLGACLHFCALPARLAACLPARNFRFRHERVQIKVESTLTLMAVAGHVIDGS